MRAWILLRVGLVALACANPIPPAPLPAPAGPTPEPSLVPDGDDDRGSRLPRLERPAGPRPDDCLVDMSELAPTLAQDQPGASPVRVKRDDWQLVERVRFDDGAELRVVQQGCVHYGVTWEYAPVGEGEVVALARGHFGRVKTAAGDPVLPIDMLERGPPDAEGAWQCGEGNCELRRTGDVLTFVYDFPI